MASIKFGVQPQDLIELGWKMEQNTDGLFFYSSVSPSCFLKIDPTGGAYSIYGRSVFLIVNDQVVGKVYDASTGAINSHLLESKGVPAIAAVEFRRAVKPLM